MQKNVKLRSVSHQKDSGRRSCPFLTRIEQVKASSSAHLTCVPQGVLKHTKMGHIKYMYLKHK